MPPSKDDPRPNRLREPSGSDDYTETVHNDTYPAISPLAANLKGKSVFVSGASKGIGKAIALSYARAGASHIAIGARSNISSVAAEVEAAAKEAKRSIPTILTINLDVTKQESVQLAAEKVKAKFGKIDILINNAGILGKPAPVADTDSDAWYVTGNYHMLPSLTQKLQVGCLDRKPPWRLPNHPRFLAPSPRQLLQTNTQHLKRGCAPQGTGVVGLPALKTGPCPLYRVPSSGVWAPGIDSD